MARLELTSSDRFRIAQAREVLTAAKAIDWTDDESGPRMVGRFQVVVQSLLAILDEHGAGESR